MDGDRENSNYIICPKCKGKGYCEEMTEKKSSDRIIKQVSSTSTGSNAPNNSEIPREPKIGSIRARRTMTPSRPTMKEKIENKIPILPSKLNKLNSAFQEHSSTSDIQKGFSKLVRPVSRGSVASDSSELGIDLIGFEEVENPVEYAKIVKALLNSKEWSNHMVGLQRAVHLSRVEPELAVEMGRLICRTILDEITSIRSKSARVACQAAKEIFKIGGGFIFRPVFDEVVNVLLNRTADGKRIIREDADDALGVIASYCPIQHVTRAFFRGVRHKHPLVRKSALRILKIIVNRIGTSTLIKTNTYKDVRGLLLEAGSIFLDDTIVEIRNNAKNLMGPIVKMPEFDQIAPEMNKDLLKKVEKIIFNLKYDVDIRKK